MSCFFSFRKAVFERMSTDSSNFYIHKDCQILKPHQSIFFANLWNAQLNHRPPVFAHTFPWVESLRSASPSLCMIYRLVSTVVVSVTHPHPCLSTCLPLKYGLLRECRTRGGRKTASCFLLSLIQDNVGPLMFPKYPPCASACTKTVRWNPSIAWPEWPRESENTWTGSEPLKIFRFCVAHCAHLSVEYLGP